jgi:hypothetical protein
VSFVLYTLALGVAVADDLFRLGLVPTELERQTRGLIDQFDGQEEARRQAAERIVRDTDTFVAIPELIRALDTGSAPRRATAAACLRRITHAEHGYDADASLAERRAAVARWRAWWQQNRYHF